MPISLLKAELNSTATVMMFVLSFNKLFSMLGRADTYNFNGKG
jgi:hypothetical protein